MGLNLRMFPLGAYVTIAQSFAVASSHSLTRWGTSVFSSFDF